MSSTATKRIPLKVAERTGSTEIVGIPSAPISVTAINRPPMRTVTQNVTIPAATQYSGTRHQELGNFFMQMSPFIFFYLTMYNISMSTRSPTRIGWDHFY